MYLFPFLFAGLLLFNLIPVEFVQPHIHYYYRMLRAEKEMFSHAILHIIYLITDYSILNPTMADEINLYHHLNGKRVIFNLTRN